MGSQAVPGQFLTLTHLVGLVRRERCQFMPSDFYPMALLCAQTQILKARDRNKISAPFCDSVAQSLEENQTALCVLVIQVTHRAEATDA